MKERIEEVKSNLTEKEENLLKQTLVENQMIQKELDIMVDKFHLDFLSDLHEPRYHDMVMNYLYYCDINCYTLNIWKKLVSYLTGEELTFNTLEEVRFYLTQEERRRCNVSKKRCSS